jgi:predicted DNA-binding transcriptional regulator YafY
MRADRLVAALLVLQARGRVTAAQLAEELEVSVATARRDLESLSMAGIPVYPQPGRGGGWSLVGGARTDLSGLNGAEARALFAVAGPGAAIRPEAKAALRKLVQALPETFRSDAEASLDAVVIDPAGWGHTRATSPGADPEGALERAVVQRRRVRLVYAGGSSPAAPRLVDPWGLVDKDGVWYLIAGTDGGQRTFRVDRISELEVLDDPASRPADFDLAAAWSGVVDEVERRRSGLAATVLVDPAVAHVVHDQFGRHCRDLGPTADGRTRLEVQAPTPLMVAQPLAGWGAGLEVEGPPEVCAELARLGRELVARYGTAARAGTAARDSTADPEGPVPTGT